MTRAERYARTATVEVPAERRGHVRASLRADGAQARAWFLWQMFPDITEDDLAADTGNHRAYHYAQTFARRLGLPIRAPGWATR